MRSSFTLLRLASLLAISAAITFSSCKKDNQTEEPQQEDELTTSIEAAQNNAIASSHFDDVLNITQSATAEDAGEDIALGTEGDFMRGGDLDGMFARDRKCFTVNVIPKIRGEWPKTVTINFKDGCTGKDGKVRKGRIVSIYTKPAFMPGAVVSTTFIGYQVDSFEISGTHKVTNTSTARSISFKVEVIQGKIINTNTGFWRKHESDHEITQLDGWNSDLNPLRNGYKITGSTQGVNSNGHRWKTQTVSPLIRKFDCRWISKGILKIWRNDLATAATLDYGDGTCDDQAILTINDRKKTITLK